LKRKSRFRKGKGSHRQLDTQGGEEEVTPRNGEGLFNVEKGDFLRKEMRGAQKFL